MENSAYKALTMAAGMLVAVMIIATILFTFRRLSFLPDEMDLETRVEQAAAFNTEYTAYDKKIMYGVDVISVLNKAKSNNDKYVQEKFLSGEGFNTDYIIDIVVKLKEPLKEQITVSYLVQDERTTSEREYATGEGPDNVKAKDVFNQPSSTYCSQIYTNASVWNNLSLKTVELNTKFGSGEYHLLDGNAASIVPGHYTNAMIEGDSQLKLLLSHSTNMLIKKKNTGSNTMRKGTEGAYGVFVFASDTGWSNAVWKPAVYDLKTRKFKCIGNDTVYSDKTGRIVKMVFEEI